MGSGRDVDVTDLSVDIVHDDLHSGGNPADRVGAAVWVPDSLTLVVHAPGGDSFETYTCVRHLVHLYNRIDGRRTGKSLFGTGFVHVEHDDDTVELTHRCRVVSSRESVLEVVASLLVECFRNFEDVVDDVGTLRTVLGREEQYFVDEEHGIVELYDDLR